MKANLFFDDNGEPVRVDPAVEVAECIEDMLLDAGCSTDDLARIMDAIENHADAQATFIAGEFIRRLLMRLEGTAAAVALRRVILGAGDVTYRDAALEAGCSAKNLFKVEEKIRQRIGGG